MDYYTIGYIASGILIIIALVISAVCQSKVYSAYNLKDSPLTQI